MTLDDNPKKKKTKKQCGCPFYKNHSKIENLSDKIISKVQDIEEVVKKGRELEACPYYAER